MFNNTSTSSTSTSSSSSSLASAPTPASSAAHPSSSINPSSSSSSPNSSSSSSGSNRDLVGGFIENLEKLTEDLPADDKAAFVASVKVLKLALNPDRAAADPNVTTTSPKSNTPTPKPPTSSPPPSLPTPPSPTTATAVEATAKVAAMSKYATAALDDPIKNLKNKLDESKKFFEDLE